MVYNIPEPKHFKRFVHVINAFLKSKNKVLLREAGREPVTVKTITQNERGIWITGKGIVGRFLVLQHEYFEVI